MPYSIRSGCYSTSILAAVPMAGLYNLRLEYDIIRSGKVNANRL